MLAENTPAGAGQGTQAEQPPAASGTEAAKTFTQDELNRIVAKEVKETEKRLKDKLEKAELYDKVIEQQKQKEEAEKTELQKLMDRNKELEATATTAKELQDFLGGILQTKLEAIPEENKSLVPEGLAPAALLKWIEMNSKKLYGQDASPSFAPESQKPPVAKPDPDEIEVMRILQMQYPANDKLWKDEAGLAEKKRQTLAKLKEQKRLGFARR